MPLVNNVWSITRHNVPLFSAYVLLTSLARLQKEDVHSENERPLLIRRIAVIQSIRTQ